MIASSAPRNPSTLTVHFLALCSLRRIALLDLACEVAIHLSTCSAHTPGRRNMFAVFDVRACRNLDYRGYNLGCLLSKFYVVPGVH